MHSYLQPKKPTIASCKPVKNNQTSQTIKGVVAVDGRPDRTTETSEIHVIAPTVQAQAEMQREEIHTLVMIPCRYCQGLMDHTLTVCPNCGAKRNV
jgi:hypothetical protein